MKRIIKKMYMNILYYIFSKKDAHRILYYKNFKKKLDIDNPKNFNEKIQWLIVNKYGTKEAELTDKYLVREYIKKRGYENILTKVYGVYENVDDIDINRLPDKFVLKANNGSGNVCICQNKEEFKFNESKKILKKEIRKNYAKELLEYHYKYIKPKIICEEYLEENNKKNPLDYKFYCYDGKVECILLCSEREKELKLDYYDLEWNYLNYSKEKYRSTKKINKPQNLKNMVQIASDLSLGFPFVRIDLYNLNGKIYFGEMTFTPAAGLVYYNTEEALVKLGNHIKIK